MAFIYVRSGGSWPLQQTLTAPDGEASDQFGVEVALDGDTAMVCSPLADYEQYGNHGAGYVFTRSGTAWMLEQKISTSYNDSSIQRIAERAALEGDTALLSAPAYHGDRGGVFVFVQNGTTWSEQQELRPAVFTQNFGQRPALSGNFAVISAFDGVFSFERAPAPGVNSDGGDASAAPETDASSASDAAHSNETPRGDARESGGCGCRIHGRSGDSGGALLVLATAYLAAQRRRPSLKDRRD